MLINLHISKFIKNYLLQSFINIMTTNNFDVIYNICLCFLHKVNKLRNAYGEILQRCQLVRFTRKPYGFLRFARAYGRMMQFLRIFMIFADSNL